ncbi:MAG: hypothetical protein CSA26_07240 [Desulfobacterales bacterium]|nr:MAG: hypothetical protein CSA26_07240 [Desulfobacterales bacterium]
MAGKIMYRERMKAKKKSQIPRFRVVAVSGVDLKVYGNHFRKKELVQLAKETGAKLVALKGGKKTKCLQ